MNWIINHKKYKSFYNLAHKDKPRNLDKCVCEEQFDKFMEMYNNPDTGKCHLCGEHFTWTNRRNNAVHGIVCAVPGLSVPAAFPVYDALRLFVVRFCLAGFILGTDESPNHSLDARTRFSVAQYACVIDNDVLCFIRFHDAERYTGTVSPSFGPDVDAAQPTAALSCRFLFGSRHFSGCSLGQCFMGALLGLGSKGGMGADYFHGLRGGVPCT